jgi:small subunit ribosomal protein S20
MPITQSAKKALRQSKKRHVKNIRFKRNFKVAIKEFRDALNAKNYEKAKSLLPKVYQAVDKATKTNVLKKNTASRYKSRLTKTLRVATK